MTVQALLLSRPFILDLIIVGTYIIGTSAAVFGFYDRFHLRWTGDLKVMIATLLISSIVLSICTIINHGSFVSNTMLFTYTFLLISDYFITQLNNPKLSHEKRKQKTIKQLIQRR
jgi:hypothetical protein